MWHQIFDKVNWCLFIFGVFTGEETASHTAFRKSQAYVRSCLHPPCVSPHKCTCSFLCCLKVLIRASSSSEGTSEGHLLHAGCCLITNKAFIPGSILIVATPIWSRAYYK